MRAETVPVCNLDLEVASSLRGGDDEEEDAGIATEADLVPAPAQATLLQNCGMGTELAATFASSTLRISFPDGSSKEFYPLLLTDKDRNSWSCNKAKVRSACVLSQQANADGSVSVALKTKIAPNAAMETHRVTKEGRVHPPVDGRYFVLFPRYKSVRGNSVDRGLKILSASQRLCAFNDKNCLARRAIATERAALEELRRFRMPRILTTDDRDQDAAVLQALTDQLTGDEYLVHRAIAASEIGWKPGASRVNDSPFEILDAVLGNSGPSYGIHQIDLATNGTKDVMPFRRAMPAILREMQAGSNSPLKPPSGPIGAKKFAFEKPIRAWDISLAAEFYRAVPFAVAKIRTPAFRDDYISQYRTYLKNSAACMKIVARLKGVFLTSKVAQLYIVDVANQFGASRAVALAHAAKEFDGADDGFNEDAMRDFMIARTPYGQTESGARDIHRRFNNIRQIASGIDPKPTATSGVCNIHGLQ